MLRQSIIPTRWLASGLLTAASLATGPHVYATSLSVTLWADEAFEVYLSPGDGTPGIILLQGPGGQEAAAIGSAELAEGAIQYLHIVVEGESSDPSALIGTFTLDDFGFIFPNLEGQISTDTTHWTLSRGGFGTGYTFVEDFGPNGTAPWGEHPEIAPDARYLWSDTTSGRHTFSLVLLPTNSTPRRFTAGVQPLFNSYEDTITETKGVPFHLTYRQNGAEALALAYPGRVGARVEESPPPGSSDAYTAAWAEYDSLDFVLSTDGDATEADISLNFRVRGTLSGGAGTTSASDQSSIATSQIDVYTRINNESIFFGRGTLTARHDTTSEVPVTEVTVTELFDLDLLPGNVPNLGQDFPAQYHLDIDRTLTTPIYTVAVGTPFSVKLHASLIATATSENGAAVSRNDFTGGIHFPDSGPVFNLPPGFTVDSVSGLVRDNQFEGPLQPETPIPTAGLFMRIEDIPGESPAEAYTDWIDLLHTSSGLFRQAGGQAGATISHEDVTILKRIDKASPKLADAVIRGKVLDEVIIQSNRRLPQDRWEQFEFRLQGVLLGEYVIGRETEFVFPLESLSLNFNYINWTRRILEGDGDLSQESSAWWDLATNTGGSQSQSTNNEPPEIEPVGSQSVDQGEAASFDIRISDTETPAGELVVTASTTTPILVGSIEVTGIGSTRQISYQASSLRSGLGTVTVKVSDGSSERSIAVPVLVGFEATPYEAFISAYFPDEQQDNPFYSSPISDPDQDGIPTLIEFLLGTNPAEFTPSHEALTATFHQNDGGRFFHIQFRRRTDQPLVVGALWGSSDLQHWQQLDNAHPLYEESTQTSGNPLFEDVSAILSLPPGEAPYWFRFRATAPL